MAELLGGKAIIESLANDVQDLQWSINEIVSRIGPIQQASWKFPDKMSSDLDIEDLLDLYSYSDDDKEESQVAHIALYELVIDRFVYFVQALSAYSKQMSNKIGKETPDVKTTSVGNVAKQYINRQIQLQSLVQHTIIENKSKTRKLLEMEENMKRMAGDCSEDGSVFTGSMSSLQSGGKNDFKSVSNSLTPMYTARQFEEVARDANSKSCQTVETAFIPCEACHVVQKHFKHSGDIVIAMCKAQQLPCSMQHLKSLMADSKWMTANDVARWAGEQTKDLSRVHKNMDTLVEKIHSLKEEIANYEKKCKELQRRVSNFDFDMNREKEVQAAIQRQCDIKLKELEQGCNEKVSVITREKDQVVSNKEFLERELQKMKESLQSQQRDLKKLEEDKQTLEANLSEKKATYAEVQRLQGELSTVEKDLSEVRKKHEKSVKELSKELAKGKSSAQQSKSLQSKQDSLRQRVDILDQENQELRNEVADLEEEKEQLEESLEKAKDDAQIWKKKLQEEESLINHLNREKERLQESVKKLENDIMKMEKRVQEANERERLLVEYPDLNGPVNADLNGTGDIVMDMQNQVKANTVRIHVLDQQNEGLRNSISKLLQTQEQQPPKQAWHEQSNEPVQLWNNHNISRHKDNIEKENPQKQTHWAPERSQINKNNSADSRKTLEKNTNITAAAYISSTSAEQLGGDKYKKSPSKESPSPEFLVGRALRPPSNLKKRDQTFVTSTGSRPQSGKVMTPINNTSIGAYVHMKKSQTGGDKAGSRPATGKMTTDNIYIDKGNKSPEEYPTVYSCIHCDKMYTKVRDLEIHKTYCTG